MKNNWIKMAAAAAEGAPIVLTETGALPEATDAYLDTLGLRRVVVLGGDLAVGPDVRDALELLLVR